MSILDGMRASLTLFLVNDLRPRRLRGDEGLFSPRLEPTALPLDFFVHVKGRRILRANAQHAGSTSRC